MIRTNDQETMPSLFSIPFSSSLLSAGISTDMAKRWATMGRLPLLPLQEQAIKETSLLKGGNVIVFAPTSSGKTGVAELAMLRHIGRKKKAVFLSPTRALAHEKYREFCAAYENGDDPLRIAVATREFGVFDQTIRDGDFDIAVMVYEKFHGFMEQSPWFYDELGCVIADEVQLIGDFNRGQNVDRLLSRLAAAETIQIVALSAVMDDSPRLAAWLNAEALVWNRAATDLREGVFCHETGGFHFSTRISQEMGVERGWDWCGESGQPAIPSTEYPLQFENTLNFCSHFARRNEGTIVFVPTRRICRDWALTLAHELGDLQTTVENPYAALESGQLRTSLESCFRGGVAFHSGDLSATARHTVENAFRDGLIRILVATPTLAQGMNLHARNVIQIHVSPEELRANKKMPPLTVERYKNQAGRAGRIGTGDGIARSILIADTKAEAETLWQTLVEGELPELRLSPTDRGMQHFVLDCLEDGRAKRFSLLHRELENSLWWSGAKEKLPRCLERCITTLLKHRLIVETDHHDLEITGRGSLMLRYGLSVEMTERMTEICMKMPTGHIPTPLELLCLCALMPDTEHSLPVSLSPKEKTSQVWQIRLKTVYGDDLRNWSDYAREILQRALTGSSESAKGIKLALLAYSWMSDSLTAELEDSLHFNAGSFSAFGEHLAWLAGALGAFAERMRNEPVAAAECRRLAVRLTHGVADDTVEIARLDIPGLTRDFLHALRRDGFDTPLALATTRPENLRHILPSALNDQVAAYFHRHFRRTDCLHSDPFTVNRTDTEERFSFPEEEDSEELSRVELRKCAAGVSEFFNSLEAEKRVNPVVLVFDEGQPGWVSFHGKRVRLTPKPYQLLFLLAKHAGETVSYLEIDSAIWPGEKVEPQQISAHKATICRELEQVQGGGPPGGLITTDKRFGLRLELDKAQVRFIPRISGSAPNQEVLKGRDKLLNLTGPLPKDRFLHGGKPAR